MHHTQKKSLSCKAITFKFTTVPSQYFEWNHPNTLPVWIRVVHNESEKIFFHVSTGLNSSGVWTQLRYPALTVWSVVLSRCSRYACGLLHVTPFPPFTCICKRNKFHVSRERVSALMLFIERTWRADLNLRSFEFCTSIMQKSTFLESLTEQEGIGPIRPCSDWRIWKLCID